MKFQRFKKKELFKSFIHRNRNLDPRISDKKTILLSDLSFSKKIIDKFDVYIKLTPGEKFNVKKYLNFRFYIYFSTDDISLKILEDLHKNNIDYVPELNFSKTDYRFTDQYCLDTLKFTFKNKQHLSHFDLDIHQNICEAINITKNLNGDYVEIGVYKGGSAFTALKYLDYLKQNKLVKKRNVFLLDTFEGFKYKKASESNDIIWFDTHALYGEDKTKKKISKILLKCNYDFSLITNNIVDDQVPEIIKKVVVANIDVDMYEPTIECLKKISPIVVKGGIIIIEDSTSTPGLYGAYLAMNQFINSREGSKYTKLFKKGQYFLIKNE